MNKKQNFITNSKREIKEWWNNNKGKVKVGLTCGLIGIGYGFIKGILTNEKMWVDRVNKIEIYDDEEPCDEFGLTESNCDDPELLELVRFENENA